MNALELLVMTFGFALLRYLPVTVMPALSPLSWAPPTVRITVLLALAWLTVLASWPIPTQIGWHNPLGLVLAAGAELLVGLTFGLTVLLPQAAIGMSARLADTQAGLSAASLFNPNGQHEPDSAFGTVLMLAATVLFFSLDLHLHLLRMLTASLKWLPLGALSIHLNFDAFLELVGRSFVLGLAVTAPVILGMFAVDIGVSYATRSMPQANVYFLALPLKVAIALLLLAATLILAPALIGRLFLDAFDRLPGVLGA